MKTSALVAVVLCAACGSDPKLRVDAHVTGCTGDEARLLVFSDTSACADEDPRNEAFLEHEVVASTPWIDPETAGPVSLDVPVDGPVAVVAQCQDTRGVVTQWGCGVQQGRSVHVEVQPICTSRCARRGGCPDGSEVWEGGGGQICVARCGECAPDPDAGPQDAGALEDAGIGDDAGVDAGPPCTPLEPRYLPSIGGEAQGLARLAGDRLVVAAGGANGAESLVGALPDLARTDPASQDLSEAFAVAGSQDWVYVAAGSVAESEHNLEVLHVGGNGVLDPPAGQLLSGEIQDVAATDSMLYAAAGTEGLLVLSLADHAAPSYQNRAILDEGAAMAVAVVGQIAIVGAESGGVYVVDVQNPASPAVRSRFAGSVDAIGVAVSAAADRVLVARGDAGVDVLTLDELDPPELLAHIDAGGSVRARIFGARGFVAMQQAGILVVDLETGAEVMTIPPPLDEQAELVSVRDVLVEGTWAVVAGGWDGLWVVDVRCALP